MSNFKILAALMAFGVTAASAGERETFDFGWKFKYFGPEDPAMLGSHATADNTQGGHSAALAVDGDLATRWCADDYHEGHYIELRPGITDRVKEVRIDWESPNEMMVHAEYKADGEDRVCDVLAGGAAFSVFSVGGHHVSELKLSFFNTDPTCWASVREVSLIGMDGKVIPLTASANPYLPAHPDYNDRSEIIPGDSKSLVSKLFGRKEEPRGFRSVQLPHDWAIESPFLKEEPNETGKLPWNGWAWYRKNFSVPADFNAETQRWYLDFDGVMSHPKVFVNGRFAGEWAYGYAPFRIDITPYLRPGKRNLVAVMVSNLPLSTRWYPGAGIYRHVWLEKTAPVHLANWGVGVTTPAVSEERAQVHLESTVENNGSIPVTVRVKQQIEGAVAESAPITIEPGDSAVVQQDIEVAQPRLWGTEKPEMYEVKTEVLAGDVAMDAKTTPFGIRTIEWKPDGFYLNGERVQLKGVCEHHDLGALGSAFYSRAYERKIEILKEMGCNSIRMTHNPPAAEVLELCDKHGILVIDELFDIWKYQKYDKVNGYHVDWPRWWKRDVRNFVLRDRNHPSVVAWSGGNEVPEIFEKDGPEICAALRDEFRKYDTSRPYTVGCNSEHAMRNGFSDAMDVFGFNYRPQFYPEFRSRHPEQAFYGSETQSCVATRDTYLFPLRWEVTKGADDYKVSSYGIFAPHWGYCPDVEFYAQDNNPTVAGEYVWTGFDYIGEPTPYNQDKSNIGNFQDLTPAEREKLMAELEASGHRAPSRSSYFGIIDLAGFPKDNYYNFLSRWRPEVAHAHILPHWNWPGREGQKTPVMVYSSGDEAELFLNGRSLGVRHKGDGPTFKQKKLTLPKNGYRFVWEDVTYEPGTLEVVVKKGGKVWATAKRETTGKAASVACSVDRPEIVGDGRDLSYISLVLKDEQGREVLTDCRKVSFRISGAAELVGFCNGDPTDWTCMQDPNQKFFNGRIVAIVRGARNRSGKATVRVAADDLPAVEVPITVLPATAEQLRR